METVGLCLTAGTFLVALLAFLATVTDWFKKRIPIEFGFLLDERIVQQLSVSTGDPAKPVTLRFRNSGETALTGVVLDMRFLKPIVLSGTSRAITFIPEKTTHGRTEDGSFYLYRHSELIMGARENIDFRVELNTQSMELGTHRIAVTVYSTQQDYKYKKTDLVLRVS